MSLKISVLKQQNTIKAPHRYAVQVSDTTMLPIDASLFGQLILKDFRQLIFG